MSEHFEYLVRTGDPELVLARAGLAQRQAELLGALVADGPVPDGFDRAQVRIQARGLAAKRRDTVARVAPDLARILGADFGRLFPQYARQGPPVGGYRADARAFAEWAAAEPVDANGSVAPWRQELDQWLRPAAGPARGRLRLRGRRAQRWA